MNTYMRTMSTVAVAGVLLVAGAGVADASEGSGSPGPADQPNCLAMTLSGAAADPAGTLTGTLKDPGAATSATLTCVMSLL